MTENSDWPRFEDIEHWSSDRKYIEQWYFMTEKGHKPVLVDYKKLKILRQYSCHFLDKHKYYKQIELDKVPMPEDLNGQIS